MADPLCIEDSETASERSRQLDVLKDVLSVPLSERCASRLPSAGPGPQTGMIATSGLSRDGAASLIAASIVRPTTIPPSQFLPGSRTGTGN